MKLARVSFAATAAASLLAASLVLGCDSKNATSQTAAGAGCGAKATGAKATTVANTKSGCDAKAMKTAGGKGCCAKNAAMAKAKGSCSGAQATAMTAECTLKPGRVALTGTVACNHCDLKKTETCQSILMASNGCHYALADSDNTASLRTEGRGQQVKIKGRVDNEGLVAVTSFKVVGPATPNVGM